MELLDLLKIPEDCLNEITLRLKQKSMIYLSLTCKYLHDKVKVKSIYTSNTFDPSKYQYVESIVGIPQEYTNLKFLRKLRIEYRSGELILNELPNLTNLNISTNFIKDVSQFHKLVELECGGLPLGIEKLKLKTLKLTNVSSHQFDSLGEYPYVNNLSLDATSCRNLLKISDHFPNLTKLNIGAKHIENVDLTGLVLKTLDAWTEFGMLDISQLTMIESLTISGYIIHNNLRGFTNLTKLHVYESYLNISDYSHMTKLKKLTMIESDQVTKLPKSITELNCDNLTADLTNLLGLPKGHINKLHDWNNQVSSDVIKRMSNLKVLEVSEKCIHVENSNVSRVKSWSKRLDVLNVPNIKKLTLYNIPTECLKVNPTCIPQIEMEGYAWDELNFINSFGQVKVNKLVFICYNDKQILELSEKVHAYKLTNVTKIKFK